MRKPFPACRRRIFGRHPPAIVCCVCALITNTIKPTAHKKNNAHQESRAHSPRNHFAVLNNSIQRTAECIMCVRCAVPHQQLTAPRLRGCQMHTLEFTFPADNRKRSPERTKNNPGQSENAYSHKLNMHKSHITGINRA